MRDVFISYATEDHATAEAACAALEATGLRCWIAPRDIHPGSAWGEAIVEGISHCASFVLVFSDAANRSHHIPRELECAVDRNLPIIPFRVEPVMPSKSLSYFIASSQWLEGQPPPLEQHLDDLIEAVRYQLTPSPTAETKTQAQQIPPGNSDHEMPSPSTRPPGQHPDAEAIWRRRRKLLTLGIVSCALALGAGEALRRTVLHLGGGASDGADPPAACGSAYGAGQWNGALAQCVGDAAVGNVAAQRLVGVIYRRGLGVAKNPDRAATWFQRAARHGDEEARAKLWEMYGDHAASVSDKQPYAVNEVLELVTSGARPQVILSLATESCLRFSLDSATADRLLAADATRGLVAGLRSACHVPTTGEAPPISIAQLDALVRRRSQAQVGSARAPAVPPSTGTTAWLALEKAWRSLLAWVASVIPPPAARARPVLVPRLGPRTAATSPAEPAAPTPPTGGPAPEQKGTGSILDAAKKGAQEAAEEEARRKAGEAVKKVLNFH